MKAGIVVTNTYRDAAALTAVSMAEVMQLKSPARSMFDAQIGQESVKIALRLAQEADELGFDHLSVSEHHFMPFICEPNSGLFAAALCQLVKKATIGWLGPIVSINNPVRIAEEIAMLDQLSGGNRLMVYLLKGTPNEHMYYGHNGDEARARGQEAALLIKKALTEPEPFAWEGKFWSFPVVSVWPGATTKPMPKIYTSGSQKSTIEFAAENGFSMAAGGAPEYVKQMTELYRARCQEAGWTPAQDDVLTRGVAVVGESDAHAEDLLGRLMPHPDLAGHAEALGSASPDDTTKPASRPAGRPFFPVLLQGSASTALEQARELARAGIGVLDLVPDFGGLPYEDISGVVRRLGTDVLPTLHTF